MKVQPNALVWASHPHYAMTWMDAVVDTGPVTGRDGYQVEINALWYNAICYTLELASKNKDKEFVAHWGAMPNKIKASFVDQFWHEEGRYLADYVDEQGQNLDIRPNQIIACALPYTMLDEENMRDIVEIVRLHLLTPKGLRTLTPCSPLYKGRYDGDQPARDRAYHQGTVWPWLLEHYVQANFKLYGNHFLGEATDILRNFEEDISLSGIASISEIYDGDPPHEPKGAISQAWSVGSILRIEQMIREYGVAKK